MGAAIEFQNFRRWPQARHELGSQFVKFSGATTTQVLGTVLEVVQGQVEYLTVHPMLGRHQTAPPFVRLLVGPDVDRSVRDFCSQLYACAESHELDRGIDLIFGRVDRLLREAQFTACDQLLMSVDPSRLPIVFMRAFLTITYPVKTRLPHRQAFLQRVTLIMSRKIGEEPTRRALRHVV